MLFVEPTTILTVAELAIEKRKAFLPLLKRLKYWMKRGQLIIAMFGPGGTGKSTVGNFLAGNLDVSQNSPNYRESLDIEKYKLKGDLVCKLIVVPGQHHREYYWTDLYRDLASGKSGGIINVVSYGYHSFQELSYKDTGYYKDEMTKEQFLNAYLENRRAREQQIIENLTPRLIDAKEKIWMVTLVTKQDLWWAQRKAVQKHYMEGPYNDCIKSILLKRGEQHFTHDFLSASVIMSNLTTGSGELLAETTGGYDQFIQFANSKRLVETIDTLASR